MCFAISLPSGLGPIGRVRAPPHVVAGLPCCCGVPGATQQPRHRQVVDAEEEEEEEVMRGVYSSSN